MISFEIVANLLVYCMIGAIWFFLPVPRELRRPLFQRALEDMGFDRRRARVAGVAVIGGVLPPALLGWAPFSAHAEGTYVTLASGVYPAFYVAGVVGATGLVGRYRLRRAIRAGIRDDYRPPTAEGPIVVSAIARRGDRAVQERGDESETLVYDYRKAELRLDEAAVETLSESAKLRDSVPFVLDGLDRPLYVDPADAWLELRGDGLLELKPYAWNNRIQDGDEVTVVGTVRTARDGRRWITGDDDFLFISNTTLDQLRLRLRIAVYVGAPLAVLCLAITTGALYAVVP